MLNRRKSYPKQLSTAAALAVALFSTFFVTPILADQDSAVGSGDSASASLDFTISIPTFLVFRLGTAGVGNVDLIDFDLVGGGFEPGSGTPVAATGASGDLGSGEVTVGILTNLDGNLSTTVTAAASGLSDGATNTISFDDITTNSSATLNAPQLTDGISGAVTTAVSGVTNTLAAGESWTFSYDNTVAYEAGTYGGANVNDGRVVYTVTLP